MKNIARTGLGVSVVILSAMVSVFAAVVVILCTAGFALLAQLAAVMIRIKKVFHTEDNGWTSYRHWLGHNLENLGPVSRILH